MNILVLEDDGAVAQLYADALNLAGHNVRVFHSFEEARRELRARLPDALLTDVRLGEYNGLQLALLYRMLSPNGRILVVSGHDDATIRREAANMGAEFFVKPIDMEFLRNFFVA
jgi:DNA-binding response OmpR family regulator